MTRAVAYFGTYEPDYPRNAVLIAGLREHGVEVHEFHAALPRLTAAEMAGARGAARLAAGVAAAHARLFAQHRAVLDVDAVVVGYPGHFLVPFGRLLAALSPRSPGVRPAGLPAGHVRRRPRPRARGRRQGRRDPRRGRGRLPPPGPGARRHLGARRLLSGDVRAGAAPGGGRPRRRAARTERRTAPPGSSAPASRSRCCSTASGARCTAPRSCSERRSCSAPSRSASCSSARDSSPPSCARRSPRAA